MDKIYLQMAIGCGEVNATSQHAIRLEFSSDDGVSWNLVLPHCYSSNNTSQHGCNSERHPASIYYPGSWRGWKRMVIPLWKLPHICKMSPVRFRWSQGFYFSSAESVTWAIDDVYIGPGCDAMCNGRGYCNGGGCVCDVGYEGNHCQHVINSINSRRLIEGFESGKLPCFSFTTSAINSVLLLKFFEDLWLEKAGGAAAPSECENALFARNRFVMNQTGSRILMTKDINTSRSR